MISKKVLDGLGRSSAIRAMFEEGERLRRQFGPDKVYDFSIGNPEIEPPAAVDEALVRLAREPNPGKHRYMSNAGYDDVRRRIAARVSREQGVPLEAGHIVMTCGAAGGLNVVLKTLLDPGDEVLVIAPFFMEYLNYIDNSAGRPVIVPSVPDVFEPDLAALEKAVTPRTKALILNTPNNPTGAVYSRASLEGIAEVLGRAEKRTGRPVYVVSDEPYAKIVYDGVTVPGVLGIFPNAIVVNSYSKSLALPGERIGYIAASSAAAGIETLMDGLVMCNRTLGFVNAPALFQKVVAETLDATVDLEWYRERRDTLYNHLVGAGFSCLKPQGAFYLFPKSPVGDDAAFVRSAAGHNLLLVPGRSFSCPGYFRIAYCMSLETIRNSLPAFTALAAQYGLQPQAR